MKRILISTFTAALLAGCGANLSGYGDLTVEFDFNGVEIPEKVTIYVLDGAENLKCSDLEYTPETGLFDYTRNLPVEGDVSFVDLPDDRRWIVYGVGSANNGVRVAHDCKDNIRIRNNQLTMVELELENVPMGMDGSFRSDMELDLQPPTQMLVLLVAFDIACNAADLGEGTCAISSAVANVLADLDVKVRWDMNQRYDAIRGEMIWEAVEGVPVGPEWKLVTGGFNGEIPGATGVVLTTNDLKIHMDQVVLFVIQEVEGYDLDNYGPQVELIMESFVSDMKLLKGTALAVDNNFDGEADVIIGEMDAEITFPQFNNATHALTLEWYSQRN